jgi:transcriptional regulator with XRE-family HTH domain
MQSGYSVGGYDHEGTFMAVPDMLLRLSELSRGKRGSRSLREVAEETGLSAATFHRMENCQGLPDLVTFRKLCLWLGMSADEILCLPHGDVKQTDALMQEVQDLRQWKAKVINCVGDKAQ